MAEKKNYIVWFDTPCGCNRGGFEVSAANEDEAVKIADALYSRSDDDFFPIFAEESE